MKKIILIALIASACSKNSSENNKNEATKSDTTATVSESNKKANEKEVNQTAPTTSVYRCDACHNGLASEWVKLYWEDSRTKITKMEYWSSANEKPAEMKIVSQEFSGGEISGITGKVQLPDSKVSVEFSIVEDKVNLDGKEYSFENQ